MANNNSVGAPLAMSNLNAAVPNAKNVSAMMANAVKKVGEVNEKLEQFSVQLKAAAEVLAKNAPALANAAGAAANAAVSSEAAKAAVEVPAVNDMLNNGLGSVNASLFANAVKNNVAGPPAAAAAAGGARRFLRETVKQLRQFSGLARSTAKAMRGGMLAASRMASQASSKVEGTVQRINSQVPTAVQHVNSMVSQMGGKPSSVMPKIGSSVVKTLKSVFKVIAKQAAAVGKAKSKKAKGKQDGGFFSLF